MSLKDYAEDKDHFQLGEQEAHFSFPCCCCQHRMKSEKDMPCAKCGHNVNPEDDE